MVSPNYIFLGIGGSVVALDPATGAEVWTSLLKGYEFVSVALLDGQLYAATKGEFFALDPATGRIRWVNKLKGRGRGLISIATLGGDQAVLQAETLRGQEQSAASGAPMVPGGGTYIPH